MMKQLTKILFVLLVVAGISSGCDSFVSPSLDQSRSIETAVKDVSNLRDVVKGGMDQLSQGGVYGRDLIINPSVMSDNAYSNANSGRLVSPDQVNFTENSGYASGVWDSFYEVIASANFALQASEDLESSPEVKNVKGQAYALRALAHMELLVNFGQQYVSGGDKGKGIPYITSYAEGEDQYPSRNSVSEVWKKVGSDFKDAIRLMDKSQFDPTLMNYWAAKALQTRYYLYSEQYSKVKTAAKEIISSGNFGITGAGNYTSEWASGIPGSLLEVAFNSSTRLGIDGIGYLYLNTEYGDASVTDDLFNTYKSGDVRLGLYTQDNTGSSPFYRMTGKFVNAQGEDNVPVIRYAEVILNYAEALAQKSATQSKALTQLNKITSKRNVPSYGAGTVNNVLKERRLELAMEGQRFHDLARTGRNIPFGDSDSYRQSVIPSGDSRLALPIPNAELQANSNIEQNKGY